LKPNRLRSASIAAVLVVVLTGCDAIGGQDDGGESRPAQDLPASPSVARPSGEAASSDGRAPAQPGDPFASQEVRNDGAVLRVDITGLKRTDRLVTLSWNITVVKGDADGDWTMSAKMSVNPAGTSASDYDVSGVTLVDPVNSKRYLVARSVEDGEDQGTCVCSKASPYLRPGDGASFYAAFTAPPPEVTKVNVDLVIGTFNDVPVS
jgi:hypothetical protein